MATNSFKTHVGDVLIRDHAGYFQVWLVLTESATQPDPGVEPFTADRYAEAIEHALMLTGATRGRVLSIDGSGAWSEVRGGR